MNVLDRLDEAAQSALALLGRRAWLALPLLLVLCACSYGPGFLRLPPIDRTEVVFAESSREMLEHGRLIDPRYEGERERHRPIGTFWAQMAAARAAAAVAGQGALAAIQPYRLPSLISVALAVLMTGTLLRPLIGGRAALVAAALFAVTPIAALQAQLGIAESVVLAPAIAAQLSLLRLYALGDSGGGSRRWLSLLFWASQGVAITLDALLVPILTLATLAALLLLDRDRRWLGRIGAAYGVPLMVLLGAPWIIALSVAEGGMPFSGLSAMEITKALGGSQAMKFKAWPLTFTLGLLVGLLFCAPLLAPAARRLWSNRRSDRVARFLFAWLAGYLAYLELISSKPALYSVQVILPAATAAVAMVLTRDGEDAPLAWDGAFPAWPGFLFAALVPALYVAAQHLADAQLGARAVAWAIPAAVLLALAAAAARARRAAAWVVLTVAGAAVFLGTTFGVLMPRLEKGWTTEVVAGATLPLAACAGGPAAVVGYREPSAVFAFRPGNVHLSPAEWLPGPGAVAVEDRHRAAFEARASSAGLGAKRVACLETLNVTRGCRLNFTVFVLYERSRATTCAAAEASGCEPGRSRSHKACS